MFENRINEFLTHPETDETRFSTEDHTPAFVACPVAMFAGLAAQQAQVAAIYNAAREMTEAQLRKPARRLLPAFSLN
ncbi:MAG: hypothetical protein U0792_14550 [Gemmataceae bacterium]